MAVIFKPKPKAEDSQPIISIPVDKDKEVSLTRKDIRRLSDPDSFVARIHIELTQLDYHAQQVEQICDEVIEAVTKEPLKYVRDPNALRLLMYKLSKCLKVAFAYATFLEERQLQTLSFFTAAAETEEQSDGQQERRSILERLKQRFFGARSSLWQHMAPPPRGYRSMVFSVSKRIHDIIGESFYRRFLIQLQDIGGDKARAEQTADEFATFIVKLVMDVRLVELAAVNRMKSFLQKAASSVLESYFSGGGLGGEVISVGGTTVAHARRRKA